MASRTAAKEDFDSDSWSGEYSIGPGGSALLVRYKSRRGDFDPCAYHAKEDDCNVTARTKNDKTQDVSMNAPGPETKLAVKQECTQEKACNDRKSPEQSPPMKKSGVLFVDANSCWAASTV